MKENLPKPLSLFRRQTLHREELQESVNRCWGDRGRNKVVLGVVYGPREVKGRTRSASTRFG